MASRRIGRKRGGRKKPGILNIFSRIPNFLLWGWGIWSLAVIATLLVWSAPPLASVKQSVLSLVTPNSIPEKAVVQTRTKAPGQKTVVVQKAAATVKMEESETEGSDVPHRIKDASEIASTAVDAFQTADLPEIKILKVTVPFAEKTNSQGINPSPTDTQHQVKHASDLLEPETIIGEKSAESSSSHTVAKEKATSPVSSIIPDITESAESQGKGVQKENHQSSDITPFTSSEPIQEPVVGVDTQASSADSSQTSAGSETEDLQMPFSQTKTADIFEAGTLPSDTTRFMTRDKTNRMVEWDQIKFEGVDRSGNTVKMVLLVLSESYFWRFGGLIITDKEDNQLQIRDHLTSARLKRSLKHSKGLICVGTASEEGALRLEEYRAALRADRLVEWMIDTQPDINTFYALGLGQYQNQPAVETLNRAKTSSEDQRRIILINITHQAPGANLTEALKNGLKQLKPLPFELQQFSSFDLRNRSSLI